MHGFMGEYISHETVAGGISFCDTITRSYPENSRLSYECYRGTGNGLTFRYGLLHWNDADEIVKLALADCRQVANKDACINGVYSGIDHMYFGVHGYEIRIDPSDPFALCSGKEDSVRSVCIEALVSSFFAAEHYDLNKTLPFLADMEPRFAKTVINTMVRIPFELPTFEQVGYGGIVRWCRKVPHQLADACLNSFVQKLLTIDETDNTASHLAAQFCTMDVLTPAEQTTCTTAIKNYSL
jgi:hypothetical protein